MKVCMSNIKYRAHLCFVTYVHVEKSVYSCTSQYIKVYKCNVKKEDKMGKRLSEIKTRKCVKLNKLVKYKTGMQGKNSLSCLLDLKSDVKTCFPNVSKDMTHQPWPAYKIFRTRLTREEQRSRQPAVSSPTVDQKPKRRSTSDSPGEFSQELRSRPHQTKTTHFSSLR